MRDLYLEGGSFGDAAADLAVLVAWGVVGVVVALKMFRWEPREG